MGSSPPSRRKRLEVSGVHRVGRRNLVRIHIRHGSEFADVVQDATRSYGHEVVKRREFDRFRLEGREGLEGLSGIPQKGLEIPERSPS